MINLSSIKNIIFDFGGVLFEINYEAPIKAFAALGFIDFSEVFTQAKQQPVIDQYESGKISDELFLQFLESRVSGATREQLLDAWNSILLHIMPEQVEVVEKLKGKGYKTYLLSNTNAIHVAKFESLIAEKMNPENFRKAFDEIYYSNVIGLKKPHEEIFLKVCEWNSLNPAETLFIDDSIQHVLGAESAGLQAYHLKSGERLTDVFVF